LHDSDKAKASLSKDKLWFVYSYLILISLSHINIPNPRIPAGIAGIQCIGMYDLNNGRYLFIPPILGFWISAIPAEMTYNR